MKTLFTTLIFPPLGYVLAVMIGIGVAEGSGLFNTVIRALVLKAPTKLITGSVVLAGVLSHLASEAGYVILIPLGAMIFYAIGRHPMAGLAAAFCGVSGGFGANFLIGSVDPILAGLSETAAHIIDPSMKINAAVNFYFMFVSAFMIVIVGTLVTEKIVEPRLKKYVGDAEKLPVHDITPIEKKGLKWAGIWLFIFSVALAFTIIPENGLFRNPETGTILHSPFFDGIITGILVFFFIPGLAYGIVTKSIRNDTDMMKHIIKSMGTMATYIVLVFFAAHPEADCPADSVIGQKDFLSAYELPYDTQGSQRLRFPYAIDVCEQVLAVADTANNRVLFWRLPFTRTCFADALDVLGQADFSGNGDNRWESVNQNTLCWPYGICFHEGMLAIADSGNNRVMIWDCSGIIEYEKATRDAKADFVRSDVGVGK